MALVDDINLKNAAFVEIPGMRGLRVARIGAVQGRTLEVIEATRGVIIPALMHPSGESGRVLAGSIRFMQDGIVKVLKTGDTWRVEANTSQGPHVVLEDGTRVAVLRDGKSALDVV